LISAPSRWERPLLAEHVAGWVEGIIRFAWRERIKKYSLLMLAITPGGGVLRAALGPGLLSAFGHVIEAGIYEFAKRSLAPSFLKRVSVRWLRAVARRSAWEGDWSGGSPASR
jgi:hypothetical protein